MIFQHALAAVLDRTKTQTRRLIKPGQRLSVDKVFENNRLKYAVGQSYAVQPGRAKKGVGRIKVLSIRQEDVRDIPYADAQAEGGFDVQSYLCLWAQMYDKALDAHYDDRVDCYAFKTNRDEPYYQYINADYLADIVRIYRTRPDERYQAWVIEFELVEATP